MKTMKTFGLISAVLLHTFSFGAIVHSVATHTLWEAGKDGYHTYRIPAVVTTTNGTLLAFCEGRVSSAGDTGNIDLIMKRSVDGGATWSDNAVIWSDGANTCGNPVPVVDQSTGKVLLLMTWNNGADSEAQIKAGSGVDTRRVFVCSSIDDGLTWSTPAEITSAVKDVSWGWYATGPGGGIQLTQGDKVGRLVAGCNHSDVSGVYKSHAIYSDDGGSTWMLGGVVPGNGLNESQVVELSDGRVLINMRNYNRPPNTRQVAVSTDFGVTWSSAVADPALIEPICEGSIERVRAPQGNFGGAIAFLNPAHESVRSNLTLRVSLNDAGSWQESYVLEPGKSGYSDLAVTANGTLAALYEGGNTTSFDEIRLALITLDNMALVKEGLAPLSEHALFESGMQAWFNANDLESMGDPVHGSRLARWESQGATAPVVVTDSGSRPNFAATGFIRADGSEAPMVRFNRELDGALIPSAPHWMRSELNNVTFNISQHSTWFLSTRLTYDNKQRSLFGLNINNSRWGGFFLGDANPPNRLRPHNSSSTADVNQDLPKDVGFVFDSRRSTAGVDTTFNGAAAKHSAGGLNTMPAGGAEFRIAGMIDSVSAHAVFDLAEIIIYNRAVSDAERVIIHNAMAARSGATLSSSDVYAGGDGPSHGYFKGVTGIGYFNAAVYPVAGAVMISPSSGGLVVEQQNNTLNMNGEFVCLGYKGDRNGWLYDSSGNRRLYREWYVQKTAVDGIDLKLTFDLSDGGVLSESGLSYRILYRSDCDAPWNSLPNSPTVSGDQVSFALADNLFYTGIYTLGVGNTWEQAGIGQPLLHNSLAHLFRADQRVLVTDPVERRVVAWQSVSGQSLEVAALNDAARPTLVADAFERSPNVYEPAVRFNWDGAAVADTPQVLQSAEQSALGLTGDNTWFAVGRTLATNRDRGLFGLNSSESRFGAFFLGADAGSSASTVRANSFIRQTVSSVKPEATVAVNSPFLLDIRRMNNVDGSAELAAALNGHNVTSATWPVADLRDPVPSTFLIGNQLPSTVVKNLIGDVAEIRIYNRALNDAETVIVQNHLAARYGLSLGTDRRYTGDSTNAGDFDLDVVGIGCETAAGAGRNPGALYVSDSSGGVTLSGLNNTLNQGGEYLFAGHNCPALTNDGWTNAVAGESFIQRWQREWHMNQRLVDGIDLRLTFDFETSGVALPAEPNFVLLYRKALTDLYRAMVVDATEISGSTVSFDLLNGKFANGYYTLGVGDESTTVVRDLVGAKAGITSGLRLWFRASDALSVSGGAVTGWGNLGLIGSDLDLAPARGVPQLNLQGAERASGVYEPSVAFNGSGHLVSALGGDLGIDRDLIWFVVLKPTGAIGDRGVFGTDDNTNRFGGFFTGGAGNPFRCHAFNINNNSFQRHLTVAQGSWQIADYQRAYSGSGYHLSAALNGLERDKTHAASQENPGTYRFKIGHILSDTSTLRDFIGEIAELRVYSRALMDAERMIVQNHLAARYGITLAGNNLYNGATALYGECDRDVVGVGSITALGSYVSGTVAQSEASAGLTLKDAGETLDNGEFVLVGHSGVANSWKHLGHSSVASRCWNLEWYLNKTAVDGVDIELIFDFAAAGVPLYGADAKPDYRLLYREDAGSEYQNTGVEGALEGGLLGFVLNDAALVDGLYTVGVLLPPKGSVIIVR